ncbi:glycolate oxidase subunit GlcE [Lutibaculum baratangense]|uniref:Glycolate dehydrogenase, FAD-binding subunit GlcE n=1 Tax=Lutibaculum baratangense AMV1 TaxID=631454 RepID=V4RTG9_9HYPH|nr:glycolate oxidase subunit GlcE [Lutibaculum baratangense]ESR26375.1 Glycolate dehydrogenase, FAD-binding subunit GlcE [Lutibaculum baratangense AMV1]
MSDPRAESHRPGDAAEVAAIVREAAAGAQPLEIVGGGTKRGYGRPAQTQASLSTELLTGITLYEPSEMVISARAGTPVAEVEAALEAENQRLVFEPPRLDSLYGSAGEPTVGALAAMNLSGPARVHSGAARDSLIGVAFVNGKGELIRSGGRVMKNVTGYDLAKLQAGALGTLGVLTEVTFKVLPKTETELTLQFEELDDARAVACLSAALRSPYEATGAAHLPAEGDRAARTIVRIEGFPGQMKHRGTMLAQALKAFGRPAELRDEKSRSLWRDVREVAPFLSGAETALWRASLPSTAAAAFVGSLPEGLVRRHVYDWGGALVWLETDPAGDAGAAAIRGALPGQGAHATLQRGPAELRARIDTFQPLPETLMRLNRGLKAAFDPAGILNPGRMHAGL